MHARALRADERAFQMQAKDSVAAGCRPRAHDGSAHLLMRVCDQGRQAAGGAVAPVRPGNRAHAISRRLIIEQNAPTAIHLQIYEPGCHEHACRNPRLVPTGWNLARRNEAGDAAVLHHHGGATMPGAAVKNTVRNDGAPFGVWWLVPVLAHICLQLTGSIMQQIQSRLTDTEYTGHRKARP